MEQMKAACRLELTQRARKEIGRWVLDEVSFFAMQDYFDVYIEKMPAKQDVMTFSFFFDNETNGPLSRLLDERVAIMECVMKNEGFVALSFRVKGRREPVGTNRRLPARLKFQVGKAGQPMPIQLYTSLRELPIAEERSAYVEKRIASWEGYLRIEEKNADVADITARFSQVAVNEDFTQATFTCGGLEAKDWKAIAGFSAKWKGSGDDFGYVIDVNRSKRTVKIELKRHYQALARRGSLVPSGKETEIVFSNFAELSQIRRLRKGFKDLQDGFAANPNLEKILFEERPVVQITNKKAELDFHHPLNEFQREAVVGAMSANDLYVIQGPPGTGKTTVISELCLQLVKAGMRTLVASQSNLAVDNALGRLLSDSGIRILRYGRTESIEEEGKRFIEENVAHYWKEETLAAVNGQRKARSERMDSIAKEIAESEQALEKWQTELSVLEEAKKRKREARQEHEELSAALQAVEQKLLEAAGQREEYELEQVRLEGEMKQLDETIARLEMDIQSLHLDEPMQQEMDAVKDKVEVFRQVMRFYETKNAIEAAKLLLNRIKNDINENINRRNILRQLKEELAPIGELPALLEKVKSFPYDPSLPLKLEINSLHKHLATVRNGTYTYEFQEWKGVFERLENGISHLEGILRTNGYPLDSIQSKNSDLYRTADEMHDMIDAIGRFIKTKSPQISRLQPGQKAALFNRIAENLAYLYGKLEEVTGHANGIKEAAQAQAVSMFQSIKRELVMELDDSVAELEHDAIQFEADIVAHGEQLELLEQERDQLAPLVTGQEDLLVLQAELVEGEKKLVQNEQRLAQLRQAQTQLEMGRTTLADATANLERIQEKLDGLEQLQLDMTKDTAQYASGLQSLEEVLQMNPEERSAQVHAEMKALNEKIRRLAEEQTHLPLAMELQDEWSKLLEEAGDYDLEEIRKLYVRHANVIGTTCVASARKEFMEDYPTFDVVIIDEVSKATPPELLLPMLKGKKIILVGDHHQLPPLVGRETMEEFIEEIKDDKEKNELRNMLKESLFERLFRTLPKQNKTMLGIQYRMHKEIMETITPFYAEGAYELQCGLPDSDRTRDHLLTSRLIDRPDHLLWFDMPNEPAFFEAQVKGGTSLYNEAELRMIQELLVDLDAATVEAIQGGRLAPDAKKSVGVISFYGEQVKRIDRLIEQEVMPKHLHCRTGSVDKFQGMEMDIIILSFVRNHDQPSGTIGFAEDYRRLNVALSRARELLVVVGSSEMFTKQPKKAETKAMYSRLVEQVKSQNGFKEFATVERMG
ncbi:ATP-binding protein [Sporosarcina sp. Te-1]|uniref:DEAD/DEAH box helicase n=1 Tax=Sporosarcina sp. Te-1 TaxID=2818390 RepID=UPI001A9E25DE|nr:AAA domain-containing protein [Sporosarcina sp. Te-1]QTD41017.1 AAA family ATPase [Sporosarcina sp. Te-1]